MVWESPSAVAQRQPESGPPSGSRYRAVRDHTEALAEPLSAEDQTVQSMPDVSPTKWHRAHTTWFFEEFLLGRAVAGYQPYDRRFGYLFNSYYEGVGPRHPRAERGVITRPGAHQIADYRRHVDAAMLDLIGSSTAAAVGDLVELGLHHEQQHQELLLMDIKHVLSCNPHRPAYRSLPVGPPVAPQPLGWLAHPGGIVEVGHQPGGFAFDNESPRHDELLRAFALASRTVTCGEWLGFIGDGGYRRPQLWMSDGWATVQAQRWGAPLYWEQERDQWSLFTLGGRRALDLAEPVCHVSWYEADAYARWAGTRLPLEAEWESIAAPMIAAGDRRDPGVPHPVADGGGCGRFGEVWEWTASPYRPYPGFAPAVGSVGEYNGKFMVNQFVLRGGSCATPPGHVRATYRNFFPPSARWPFAGVRLARDA